MKKFLLLILIGTLAFVSCEKTKQYTITITDDGNGVVETDRITAEKGTIVTLTAMPNEGYFFDRWSVVKGSVEFSDATGNPLTFAMPKENVTVKAEFTEDLFLVIVDPLFKEYCLQFDTNSDGILSRQEAEQVAIISILYTVDYTGPVIESFSGIEVFTNLRELHCGNSKLSGLDISKNAKLVFLYCFNNDLSTEAIRTIFSDLPTRTISDKAEIHCFNNPGSSQITAADKKVAEDKNWKVDNY